MGRRLPAGERIDVRNGASSVGGGELSVRGSRGGREVRRRFVFPVSDIRTLSRSMLLSALSRRDNRLTRRVQPVHAAVVLGAGLLGAPAVALSYPPSSDLALHEGMVALLVHRADQAFAPPGLYELALGHGNQLVYLLAWPLALALGSALACRLVMFAAIAATIGFAARLALHLGKSPWAALAVAPAALGWAFYWGFVPQMLGLALWVGALPLLDRASIAAPGRAAPRDAALATLAVAALGLAHVASMACACLASGVLALVRPIDRRTPLRLAPSLAGACLLLVEAARERRAETPLAHLFASRVLWHPLAAKLRALAANVMGGHGTLVEATLVLLVVVAAVVWRTTRVEGARDRASLRIAIERRRFSMVVAALLVAYLVAPYSVNFGAMLYVRFLAPAFVLGIVLLAPAREASGPLVAAPAIALAVAPLVVALPQMTVAASQERDVASLIDRVDEGSAVAVLHFGKHDRSLLFDPTALGDRVLAERGGRLLLSFAEYPVAPVVVRPELRWDATLLRLYGQPGALRPAHDLRRLRWVLAHVHEAPLAPRVARAFAPEGELVARAGEWMLFRSTLPAVPVTAPDEPPPAEAETLQQRVNRQ